MYVLGARDGMSACMWGMGWETKSDYVDLTLSMALSELVKDVSMCVRSGMG